MTMTTRIVEMRSAHMSLGKSLSAITLSSLKSVHWILDVGRRLVFREYDSGALLLMIARFDFVFLHISIAYCEYKATKLALLD